MEGYLLKSSLCLVVLYFFYRLVLRKESNHQVKRFVGLTCILFACSFLFIPLGSLLVADTYPQLANIIFIQGTDVVQEGISSVVTDNFVNAYLGIYFVGLFLFSLQSIYGLGVLLKWYFISKKSRKWGFKVVHVDKKITPFTFFNILFLGSDSLQEKTIKTLIVHEQYHRDQWHSVDVILLEILTIVFWFNPVVWMFKKDIKTIHEYLADAKVLEQGFDALDYQYLLFQTKTGMTLKFGSHFSHKNNLKKRISMMNRENNTSKYSLLKVLSFIPILLSIVLVSAFTQANHNLADEIKLMQQKSLKDTVPSKEALENEKFQFRMRNTVMSDEGLEPLYILKEGKKETLISLSDIKKMTYSEIATVHVLKDKAALKKYGDKGKYGAVVIQLKKDKDE